MKKTLTTYDITNELINDRNAGWSRAGAFALAEYLEEYEESTGEELELDVVTIRGDFSEYSSLQDWAHDYFSNAKEEMGFDESQDIDEEEFDERIREYIQENGQLIEFKGGIIVSSF